MDILSDYLSKEELAEQFGKSPRTIERWVRLRLIPAPVRMGKSTFFHVPSVKEAMARSAVEAA